MTLKHAGQNTHSTNKLMKANKGTENAPHVKTWSSNN